MFLTRNHPFFDKKSHTHQGNAEMTSNGNAKSGENGTMKETPVQYSTVQYSTVQYSTVQRESNLELFRIILMLAIIAHHYVVHSELEKVCIPTAPTSVNSLFLLVFGAWGKVGINSFLLITGYFMCKSNISLKKYLKLLLEIQFYRATIFCIFLLTGDTVFSFKLLLNRVILPIPAIEKRFVYCFLVFYLFIPFLNIFINSLSKRQFQLLLACLLFFYTGLSSVDINVWINFVTWFSIVYLIAAYIRCHMDFSCYAGWVWKCAFACCILLSCISVVCISCFSKNNPYFFMNGPNKILAVATAISGFLFFLNLRIPYNKWINTIASSVFGVLLIHDDDGIRTWLWQKQLRCIDFFDSKYLVFHATLGVIGIFLICTAIDQLRIRLLEKPFFHRFDSTIDKMQNKFLRLIQEKETSVESNKTE